MEALRRSDRKRLYVCSFCAGQFEPQIIEAFALAAQ